MATKENENCIKPRNRNEQNHCTNKKETISSTRIKQRNR